MGYSAAFLPFARLAPRYKRPPAPTSAISVSRQISRIAQIEAAGLAAQARLRPYGQGFFLIGLPFYIWACLSLKDSQLIGNALLAIGAIWGITGLGTHWVRSLGGRSSAGSAASVSPLQPRRYLRLEVIWPFFSGLGFALCLSYLCGLAVPHGQAADIYLILCAGAAMGIIFYCAPVLIHLLSIGVVAAAGPTVSLYLTGHSPDHARIVTGAMALSLTLAFIANRHLVAHFALQADQVRLATEREQALAAKEQMNASRIALMQTLSHEVFAGLRGVNQTLSRTRSLLHRAPAPRTQLDEALSRIAHLQSILVTTLDSHTAQMGTLHLTRAPVDIEDILRALEGEFRGEAQMRGLDFSLRLEPLPAHGAPIGDGHRIHQILHHLLSNAFAYTGTGHVEVRIRAPRDGFLRIKVIDSGPGMTEPELARAFSPHQRIDRTSAGTSGAGLGLSLSRNLAELMGAQLGAASTPEVGSKFWLDLPFDPEACLPQAANDADIAAPVAQTGQHLLILSADRLKSAKLRAWLEHHHHKCLTARSCERAIGLLGQVPIDAILIGTDFAAAETVLLEDGLATMIRFARSLTREQPLRFIALTGTTEEVHYLTAAGIEALGAPHSADQLQHCLMGGPPKG